MKIAILCRPVQPPWDSGSKNIAFTLAKKLALRGHIVYLPTVKGSSFGIKNVVSLDIYKSGRFGWQEKICLFKKILHLKEFDIFHFFFGLTPFTATVLNFLRFVTNTPMVLSITHVPKRNIFLMDCILDKRIAVTTYSRHLKEKFSFMSPEVVFPGIDFDFLAQRTFQHPDAMRKEHNIIRDAKIVLFAGEFTWKSGNDALLKSIRDIVKSRDDVVFILASRIRNRSDIKEKKRIVNVLKKEVSAGKVVILNVVPNMPDMIKFADVCILPVTSSCYKVDIPMFVIESMALKRPVVISDFAPINEAFQEFIPGRLVVPGDSFSLTESICAVIDNGRDYGEQGYLCANKYYNMEKLVMEYEKIYRRIRFGQNSELLY